MKDILQKDSDARDEIKKNIHENYFVEASAGSGKTTMLVERMLSMVEAGIDVAKISAITFTKAAANEFYSRFQSKLIKASNEGSELAREALKNIDLCFMGTIDSFCNMILSEHPVEAGIPTKSMVKTEDELMAEYLGWYKRIANGSEGETLKEKAIRITRYYKYPSEVFALGMKMYMGIRNADIQYKLPKSQPMDIAFSKEKSAIMDLIDFLITNRENAMITTKDGRPKAGRDNLFDRLSITKEIIDCEWEKDWIKVHGALGEIFFNKGLRVKPAFFDSLFSEYDKKKYIDLFIPEEGTGKTPSITGYRVDISGLLEPLFNHAFSTVIDFIKESSVIIESSLRAEGDLSYFDYLYYLRNLLKADAEKDGKLIEYIYQRHSYFLIDEFQDTNPLQGELFFYLTAEKPVPNWKECMPRKGALFIVGDPKQSIYRFRNADVNSYETMKALFEDGAGKVVSLTRNFRSTKELCNWYNDTFSHVLREGRSDVEFDKIPIPKEQKTSGSLSGTFWYLADSQHKGVYEVDLIKRMVRNPNITIDYKKEDETMGVRELNYGDFMIITYSKGIIKNIIERLEIEGIPYIVEGDVLFGECQALITVVNIMAAISRYGDNIADFKARMLSNIDITTEQIKGYASNTQEMPPSAIMSKILDDARIISYTGADNLEYFYYSIELLRAKEKAGEVYSMDTAVEFLEALISEGREETERCLRFDDNDERVHIANLHKVKGLEKEVVILAAQNTIEGSVSSSVDYKEEPPKGYIFSINNKVPGGISFSIAATSDYSAECAWEEEMMLEERKRKLYVAATRAKNALIVGSMEDAANLDAWYDYLFLFASKGANNHIGDFLKGRVIEGEEQIINTVKPDKLYEKAIKFGSIKDSEEERQKQEEATFRNELPSKASKEKGVHTKLDEDADSKYVGEGDEADDKEETAVAEVVAKVFKGNPLIVGKMVHKFMETMVLSKKKANQNALIDELIESYKDDLMPGVDYKGLLSTMAETILDGGYADQEPGVPVDILSELIEAEEVHCELPFCYKEDAKDSASVPTIWRGAMDVVYKKDGQWHILDYKTNYENENLSKEYAAQLDAYVKAFKVLTGEDADAKIYSIPV